MEKYRFFVLLGALAALLVSTPLIREFSPLTTPITSQVVVTGLFVFMLLSAALAVGRTRLTIVVATSLAVPVVLFQVLQTVFRNAVVDVPAHLYSLLFLSLGWWGSTSRIRPVIGIRIMNVDRTNRPAFPQLQCG